MVEVTGVTCPACGTAGIPGKRFCYECGCQLPACPACSSPIEPRFKFCPDCGTALIAVPSSLAVTTVAAGSSDPAAVPVDLVLLPEEEQRMDRRIVSVLFCDLVGFTPLSEKLDPEELREVQDRYFGLMSAEIERFGGTVEKYAGDAVLAIFGAPVVHEDDAERAIHCALAMHHALIPLAEETLALRGVNLMLRIGINTGEVVSGLREGGGRVDYAVTGDTVNTANRYETAAEPGGVMVAETTMKLAQRSFVFGERQMLTLKGKSQQVPGYPVVGVRERLAERWEVGGTETRLVGRQEELALLAEAWAAAQSAGRAIEIVAEPGVGKSRLLAEAEKQVSAISPLQTLRGRSLSYSTQVSLYLVADLLRNIFGIADQSTATDMLPSLRTGVKRVLATAGDEERAIAIDVFGEALGLTPGGSILAGASAQVRRHGLVQSIRQLLAALARQTPTLLILEDVHWIDGASREVLGEALSDLPAIPLLVITTRRPEGEAVFDDALWSRPLYLEPLPTDDALALAGAILGDAPLADSLRQDIAERSGGNPFFVEELLRELREADAIESADGVMQLRPGAQEKLPSSLHELLLSRLDRLERVPRTVAQVGAVIGRTFAVRLLAGTMETQEEVLDRPLEALHRADIALPTPDDPVHLESERAYIFKHATVQETAYQTLLKRRRQALHGSVARAVIDLYPADEYVETIAYHFAQTDEHREAAHWLERAADRAAAVFANDTAIEQYRETRRRQDLIDAPLADRARVDEKLGPILRTSALYDEALEHLERAVRAYRAVDEVEGERRTIAEIGRVLRVQGATEEGVSRLEHFLSWQDDAVPSSGLAELHIALAKLYFTTGRVADVAEAARRGGEIAAAVGDRRTLADAQSARGIALYHLGQTEDALGTMQTAVGVAEAAGQFEVLAILLNNIAMIYQEGGELERSSEYRERSARVFEQIGDMAQHAFALTSVGEIAFLRGDWPTAESYGKRAAALMERLGASWFYYFPLLLLAEFCVARGDIAEAETYLEKALATARENDQHIGVLTILNCFAKLDIVRGDAESVLRRFGEAVDLSSLDEADATLTTSLPYIAWAYLETGNVERATELARLGINKAVSEHATIDLVAAQRVAGMVATRLELWKAAVEHFDRALALARQVQYPYAEGLALYESGRAAMAQGQMHDARRRLSEARATFIGLGAEPYVQRTEEALAAIESRELAS